MTKAKAKVRDVYDLENMDGVGPVTAEKLREAGIADLYSLVIYVPQELREKILPDWDLQDCVNLIGDAREILEQMGVINNSFQTAKQLYIKRLDIDRVSTSSIALDELFGGGVESESVTEVYGEYGAGKTQLCHTLAVNVQRPREEGGLDGDVLYIDTENTFRPERIKSIAESRGMDAAKVLDRILVARAHNSGHQILIMEEAGTMIAKEKGKYRMIIIDSIMGNFRPEFIGRSTLASRQQLLNQHVHKLLRICEMYKIVGIVSNQVGGNPDGFHQEPGAIGGNVLAHASTYRVYLKKSGKKRIAKMVDSPMHDSITETLYTVDESGIRDIDDFKSKAISKKTRDELLKEISVQADMELVNDEDTPEDIKQKIAEKLRQKEAEET